jgi:hypothetical protein
MKIFVLHFLFLIHFVAPIFSQNIDTLHFKKTNNQFLFFPKSENSTAISASQINLFYLLLSDALKNKLEIEISNAQLKSTNNDSLVQIKYLPSLNYLVKFEKEKNQNSNFELKTMIDGESNFPLKKIRISFIQKFDSKIFAQFEYEVED